MKKLLSAFALLSLLSATAQVQAAEFPSQRTLQFEIKSIQINAASSQYNGLAPYTEVFEFIYNNHLDLTDPGVRRQWCERWQPSNVSPAVFQSRQATEKAIKNMMGSLNRKHDYFMSPADTARQKIWLNLTDTVRAKYFGNRIAYIQLPSFLPKTVDQQAQKAIASCGQAKAIILDLRGNTGGLVKPALNVAATFIPEGLIYIAKARVNDQLVETRLSLSKTRWITVTSGSEPTVTEYTTRTPLMVAASVPLVVLVDRKTASAAELLTGALKQTRRAVIIGTRTYGKGTGNKLMFLSSNGRSLQITYEKLFPGGLDTDGIGIMPDVAIDQPEGSPVDYQLDAAIKALTKQLPPEPVPQPTPAEEIESNPSKKPYGGSPYVRVY